MPRKQSSCAFAVFDAESRAAVVAEIELGEVAVQVGLAAMLIDAVHAALEDREHVLDGVGVDDRRPSGRIRRPSA